MTPEGRQKLSDSAHDFLRVVWPAVEGFCGHGRLVPTETSDNDLMRSCDLLAGIDAWQLHAGKGMRGIASRVQWIGPEWRPYNTFTVRKSLDSGATTEFEKRMRALRDPDGGWLSPHLAIQGYVAEPHRGGALLTAAVARNSDVMQRIQQMIDAGCARVRRTTDAEFYWVSWAEMQSAGYRVCIASSQQPASQTTVPLVDVPLGQLAMAL